MISQTNYERLEDAGLIVRDHEFTEDELAAIESLTSTEVDAIISAAEKLTSTLEDTSGGAIRGIIL